MKGFEMRYFTIICASAVVTGCSSAIPAQVQHNSADTETVAVVNNTDDNERNREKYVWPQSDGFHQATFAAPVISLNSLKQSVPFDKIANRCHPSKSVDKIDIFNAFCKSFGSTYAAHTSKTYGDDPLTQRTIVTNYSTEDSRLVRTSWGSVLLSMGNTDNAYGGGGGCYTTKITRFDKDNNVIEEDLSGFGCIDWWGVSTQFTGKPALYVEPSDQGAGGIWGYFALFDLSNPQMKMLAGGQIDQSGGTDYERNINYDDIPDSKIYDINNNGFMMTCDFDRPGTVVHYTKHDDDTFTIDQPDSWCAAKLYGLTGLE